MGIDVAAVGATSGAAEAAKVARSLISDPEQAHEAMRLAGAELMALRRYKPAAALFDEAAQRHANAEGNACSPLGWRTTNRREELKLDYCGATGAARVFYASFFGLAAAADPGGLRASEVGHHAGLRRGHRDGERHLFAAADDPDDDPEQRRSEGAPGAGDRRYGRLGGGDGRGGPGGVERVFWPSAAGSGETGAVLVIPTVGTSGCSPWPAILRRSVARRCAWKL